MMETGLRYLKREDDSRRRIAEADCRWEGCVRWTDAQARALDWGQRVCGCAQVRDVDVLYVPDRAPGLASRREGR